MDVARHHELHQWSVAEIGTRLRKAEVTVREVAQAHLDQIAAHEPGLGAITTIVDEALECADELDEHGPPPNAHPLWGIPVAIKCNTDLAGYPSSDGVPAYGDNIAIDDAPVVRNLRDAGAVLLACTNTPEFSLRWFTSNPLHGATRNPWNSELTPGGSSGGAAAAVAAGLCTVAHGNDLGGSLRYPAYACGVATIRPSLGRIPAMNPTTAASGAERYPITRLLAVQGPIARSIADVRAGLDAMSRRDHRDPLWLEALPRPRDSDAPPVVGFALDAFGRAPDPGVADALAKARTGLEATGAQIVDVALPHSDELLDLWGTLVFTETDALSKQAIEADGSAEMAAYYSAFASMFAPANAAGLLHALQRRVILQRAWAAMFETIDALVLPTSLAAPFPTDLDFREPHRLPDIVAAQAPLTAINVLGLPAAAVPTHLDGRTPLGVQIVGPMHEDAFVLDVAERLERELGTIWQLLDT